VAVISPHLASTSSMIGLGYGERGYE